MPEASAKEHDALMGRETKLVVTPLTTHAEASADGVGADHRAGAWVTY